MKESPQGQIKGARGIEICSIRAEVTHVRLPRVAWGHKFRVTVVFIMRQELKSLWPREINCASLEL